MPPSSSAEDRQILEKGEKLESLTRDRNACEDQLKKHQRALACFDRKIANVTRELASLERKRDLKAISPRREPKHRKGIVGLDAPLGIGSSKETLSARTPSPNPPTPPPKSPSKAARDPPAGRSQAPAHNLTDTPDRAAARSSSDNGPQAPQAPQAPQIPADQTMDTDDSSTYAGTTHSEPGELAPISDINSMSPAKLQESKQLKEDEIDSKEATPIKDSWNCLLGKRTQAEQPQSQTELFTHSHVLDIEPIRDPRMRIQTLRRQDNGAAIIPVIRISRTSLAMRDSVIAGRNSLTKDIERVRGIVFLSLSLHLRLPTLASLKGSLAIDTVDWPILIPEMDFHGMLERYYAAKCLGDDTRTPAKTAPVSNCEGVNDDVFMGDICDNCQKCQLYFQISSVFHQFIGVLLMSQYSIFDLLECWEAVTVRRWSPSNKQVGLGQGISAANADEDWVSVYVRQDHQQRVREIAEIIVESIETFAPFYDPRYVRLSQLSRFSQYSRFGTQAHGQAQAEALLRT